MTVSLKENHEFKRLYFKGRSAVSGCMVAYVRPGRTRTSRLGITVSVKLGCAVRRNRARRRLKEAYRLTEPLLKSGYDIVLVARAPAIYAPFEQLMREMLALFTKLGAVR